ncbi:MAG: DUF1559 domain-containing protein, partial [Thermogutta sp.]|nr:DUF1559 domain-containing protein [Thermogutta sp.]
TRRAVTLVEMLTVIVIISLLIAIIMPALNAARESSRQAACASNLRQIGMALQSLAQAERGMLCSGAFDWQRDGSVTSIGWVADLVNSGTPAGKLLCPSNPAVLSEAYNDLVNLDATSWQGEDPASPATWTCGVNHKGKSPETLPDGSLKRDPCEEIISTQPAPSDLRDTLVAERIYEEHYNTNFTASWFLVRSGVKLDSTGNLASAGAGCEASPLARGSTYGPLNLNMLSAGAVASSFIPLLGDGRAAANLERPFGKFDADTPLVLSFTRGPVTDPQMEYLSVPAGTPREGADGWWALWNATRQDYRGFAPVHRGSANILMADGSVQSFKDANDDGQLNNGFTADQANGYSDSAEELPQKEFWSRYELRQP